MKKTLKFLAVIFFPLVGIYCIFKNLFGGTVMQFIGGILVFAGGLALGAYLANNTVYTDMIIRLKEAINILW